MEITTKTLQEKSRAHILKNQVVKDYYEQLLITLDTHAQKTGRTDYNYFIQDLNTIDSYQSQEIIFELIIKLLQIDGFTVHRYDQGEETFVNIGW